METSCAERILDIRRISYVDILDSPQAQALLAEYSAECSIPEIGTSNPQRDTYANMEAMGLMYSFGAYKDETLVGFATVLIFVLPHYGKKIASVESVFLAKAHRRGGAGLELLAEIEAQSKTAGCCGVLYNARAGSRLERFLSAVPEYQRTNSVFLRTFS